MLYTKFQGHLSDLLVLEKTFFKVFTIFGCGGHTGHMTWLDGCGGHTGHVTWLV